MSRRILKELQRWRAGWASAKVSCSWVSRGWKNPRKQQNERAGIESQGSLVLATTTTTMNVFLWHSSADKSTFEKPERRGPESPHCPSGMCQRSAKPSPAGNLTTALKVRANRTEVAKHATHVGGVKALDGNNKYTHMKSTAGDTGTKLLEEITLSEWRKTALKCKMYLI